MRQLRWLCFKEGEKEGVVGKLDVEFWGDSFLGGRGVIETAGGGERVDTGQERAPATLALF